MSGRVLSFVEELEFAIMCGELRPKQRLVEADLADTYGVGRGIVREGLRLLEDRGLVCHHSHKGSAVIDYSAEEICHIYLLRLQMESMALALAVPRVTAEQIKIMLDYHASLRKGGLTHRQMIQAHEAFHDVLFQASGNAQLREFLQRLISRSGRVRYLQYIRVKSKKNVFAQHESILEAVTAKDTETLLSLNHAHLYGSLQSYLLDFHPAEADALLQKMQMDMATAHYAWFASPLPATP